ncbi:MAG: hypothetical protein A3E37_04350 [Candidatus Andersenbacteria bacterium RIFCSPHIGHO2_12_FULL_46_9]|nr:MAG: hypothetical protein A3B76_00430 [Candidatus Andersenbacteria bacterium RIFCSPHIGHO2_02_FULL_46_16]OGY36088.1 MAG: hypothetical protein A3E37_04350 [Candidatus Andersenbacteria bacterium RIFCSPHIGHO2_12_FULL_46_9]OGY38000.1 MAG: hypothetical protein A3I08_01280 [Candidatus Andersenbacteria bacterium RIFCSPLOWO2_02_FULL_46_11]HBE90075.1 hypothetical protein [Candidatus Andersenbacteria bacterium]
MTTSQKLSWSLLLPHPAAVLLLVIIIGGIFGGLVYLYLPHAVVTITPATVNKTVNQQILISATVKEPDFVHYKLPAKMLEKEATEKKVIERSADVTFDDFARGKVTLYNDQDEEQQLLPKTHLRHKESGAYFLTDTGVAIPPRGKVGIIVTAKDKGAAGNVKPGRFVVDKLPMSLQDAVYGESSQSFSGGVAVDKPLTSEEIDQEKEKLEVQLAERVRGMLTSAAGGAALHEDFIGYKSELETAVPVGSSASDFEVVGKVAGQAFLLDENDLLGLTLLKLRSTVEAQQEFIEYDPQSFKVVMLRRDWERGEALVEGSLTGLFSAKLGATIFKADNLAGLTREEVHEKLKQLPGIGEVAVELTPFWATVMPARNGAVEIVVENK